MSAICNFNSKNKRKNLTSCLHELLHPSDPEDLDVEFLLVVCLAGIAGSISSSARGVRHCKVPQQQRCCLPLDTLRQKACFVLQQSWKSEITLISESSDVRLSSESDSEIDIPNRRPQNGTYSKVISLDQA